MKSIIKTCVAAAISISLSVSCVGVQAAAFHFRLAPSVRNISGPENMIPSSEELSSTVVIIPYNGKFEGISQTIIDKINSGVPIILCMTDRMTSRIKFYTTTGFKTDKDGSLTDVIKYDPWNK